MKKTGLFYIVSILISLLAAGCGANYQQSSDWSMNDEYRSVFYALVSSAENSNTDFEKEYAYIEDIDDGRGYTAGIIGFTSGTGDLLAVVNRYVEFKPQDNSLKKYIPALEKVNGTDSHEGLGDAFVTDWTAASEDPEMIDAQNAIIDEMYLEPALSYAKTDGLSLLGAFIYYDALVVHGPGEDTDSFGGIRSVAVSSADTPADDGSETDYLYAFLDARSIIMLKEEAHSDLSRIDVQRQFIAEGNFDLHLPLKWTMYGDAFELE